MAGLKLGGAAIPGPNAGTTKELQLLRYLAEHPGAVLSREELLHEVWGYGASMYHADGGRGLDAAEAGGGPEAATAD